MRLAVAIVLVAALELVEARLLLRRYGLLQAVDVAPTAELLEWPDRVRLGDRLPLHHLLLRALLPLLVDHGLVPALAYLTL